ncbi:MAG: hypothetical protein ACLP75_20695 [Mycobacterium sp.]|uniref:hypothetical protein n=1 Tax=Mycobacterium sp. TaxID=1785 RepID=UPI003F97BED6
MTTNLLRSEPRHDADNQTADNQTAGDRGAQHQPPGMMARSRGHQIDGPALIEDEVGDQPDES